MIENYVFQKKQRKTMHMTGQAARRQRPATHADVQASVVLAENPRTGIFQARFARQKTLEVNPHFCTF